VVTVVVLRRLRADPAAAVAVSSTVAAKEAEVSLPRHRRVEIAMVAPSLRRPQAVAVVVASMAVVVVAEAASVAVMAAAVAS